MPRILSNYWAAGVGGGIASVGPAWDVSIVLGQWTNAGGTCWLKPYEAVFQHGAHLETLNVSTAVYNPLFDAQGSFALAASGTGVYAATFSDGLRLSSVPHYRWPLYGIGDVAPDGTLILLNPNGTIAGTSIVPAPGSLQALGGSDWIALGPGYRPIASRLELVPVTLPGRLGGLRVHGDLVLYHAEEQHGRLVVQLRSELLGSVLADGLSACWRPDFEEHPGEIVAIYATNQGEPPGSLVRCTTNRAAFVPLEAL